MDFRKILHIIAKAAQKGETVEILYPQTTKSKAGWREIEPYSLSTDIGEEGEHLVWGEDLLSPGHILNGYTIGAKDENCHSFIVGKIKEARATNKKFEPRNNWQIEF